ncbi:MULTISPECIES: response regulator transcription factor [unclassified Streptomyces]|uniref:response regulator n=1 Tax=unclassified Streptomyces TaxID=2593676 RepID=UPI002255C99C|nr:MULTISPECIES: response regulator transcription factor [unclassified Streptomyces]MCX4978066.1 response regulator transcription factor [Streptomyces sp. NBC_00620]WRZ18143.1 response regulator transcription factor [Streptomyces sp. NBC_00243]WUC15675.1 response regulator transcription factor [Streptomyces sp. NBC_00564]WUC47911.1 response regulator transcription factor [Streptomyces sp. NBC_00554]
MTIHILIVDDHPVVRFGLRGMLEAYDDLRVVGEAGSGDEAIVLAAATRPDVILMDLRMPGTDGATATARIRQEHPGIRVLVLTTYEGDADILPAIEAGATGYLLKDTPIGTLTDAIRAAARGETVLAPLVAARLVTHMQAPAGEQLTPREVQVLGLVARGLSNSEIGRQLYIGEATVKTHLLRTFVKLGVNDRTAAVTIALSRGILTTPHQ